MLEEHLFREWRDDNRNTKYPFSETASLRNDSGDFIPENLFDDARLYPIGGTARQYISRIIIAPQQVKIVIADDFNELASASFSKASPPDNLEVIDAYGRPAGILVSSAASLSLFSGWSLGEHLFDSDDTEFCASVVVPTPKIGLMGFLLDDGTFFSGDTAICGCDGVVFTQDPDGKIQYNVVGEPLFLRKIGEQLGSFETPRFIKTINHITPDEYGNFFIFVGTSRFPDPVLRIERTDNGIRLWSVGSWL